MCSILLDHQYAAVFLALSAEVGFVTKDALVQQLEDIHHVPTFQIVFFIMVCTYLDKALAVDSEQ